MNEKKYWHQKFGKGKQASKKGQKKASKKGKKKASYLCLLFISNLMESLCNLQQHNVMKLIKLKHLTLFFWPSYD